MSGERRWLRWLLPELQLYEVVKEYGWTRKPQERPAVPTVARAAPKVEVPQQKPLARPSGHVPAQEVAAAAEPDAAVEVEFEVDQLMTRLATELRRRLSLHRETASPLVEATRRWLLSGNRSHRPVGMILIAGVSGSGKRSVAEQYVQALANLELIDSNAYEEIDIGYDGHLGVDPVLLQRLEASKGQRRAYVFRGATEASPGMLAMLRDLCQTGEVRGGRQKLLLANCMVILMSSRIQAAHLQSVLGEDLWKAIHEPILLPPPDAKTLASMATRMLQEKATAFGEESGVRLSYRPEVSTAVGARALADGLFGHSVQALVEQIDAAVRQLHANGSLTTGYADVGHFDGLFVTQGFHRHTLPVDLRAPQKA